MLLDEDLDLADMPGRRPGRAVLDGDLGRVDLDVRAEEACSGRAAGRCRLDDARSSSWAAKASTRILARRPRVIRLTIDSWTLVLTRIWVMSGRLKIFCRSRTVAPSSICTWLSAAEAARVVGVDDQAVAGGDQDAVLDLRDELVLLVLLQLEGRLLGQLVGRAFSTSARSSLSGLFLGVLLEHVHARLGLLEGELGLVEAELVGDLLAPRRRSPSRRIFVGPLEAVLGALQVGLGQGDVALDRLDLLLEGPLLVLGDGDLGDLAGQPGLVEATPSACWVVICWFLRLSFSVAESSSQTTCRPS